MGASGDESEGSEGRRGKGYPLNTRLSYNDISVRPVLF